jgi:signal transduction histidine kinase
MNGVLGMTSLLLDTVLTAEQREFAETATQSAVALMAILNDLLDFSEMEAGRLGIESVEFDVRHLVEDVAGGLRVRAQEKSLYLGWSLPADVPSVVWGDPGRLRQIVTNLLANAVKFTPSGAMNRPPCSTELTSIPCEDLGG